MRCKEVAYVNRLMYIAYMTVSTRKTNTAGRSLVRFLAELFYLALKLIEFIAK